MFVIAYKKIFLIISAVIVACSLGAVLVFGLKPGIDFTGGTLLEVEYPGGRPDVAQTEEYLNELGLGAYSLRPVGDTGYLLRSRELVEGERTKVLNALSLNESTVVEETRMTTIGPVLGAELRNKAFVALGIVVLVIVLFVAFAFRGVSGKTKEDEAAKHVSSWYYGLITILALLHDVLVPLGLFAVLGSFLGAEIDSLFVMALLAILGYSINDTIVVFDRIRENLRMNAERNITDEPFEKTVGLSLQQTYARSINTSLTTLLALIVLYIIGPDTTKQFVLVLTAGVVAGAYSSIFLASPLLVAVESYRAKKAS